MNTLKIKRMASGIYYSPVTDKWIAKSDGESQSYWNIWSNEDLTEEFAIGFHTLRDAKHFIQEWCITQP